MKEPTRRSTRDGCRTAAVAVVLVCVAGSVGCSSIGLGCVDVREEIDAALAAKARAAFQDDARRDGSRDGSRDGRPGGQDAPDFPEFDEDARIDWQSIDREDKAGFGEVFLGELIAIFPGAIVPGLGHYYAGDYRTSSQLRRVGGLGIVLTAVGGGLATGGYFLDQEEDVPNGYAYGLYGTGGTIGVLGLAYYFTGWIYDIVDTPRAVRSGGKPPPRSDFVESLDIFSR
jgi:hypothetical protein